MSTLETASTRPSTPPRGPDPWWRVSLCAAGILLFIGGGMHPGAPPELEFREELATMMDDDAWVPGHTILFVAAVLFAVGLWRARRVGAWPSSSHRALRFATVAFSLYTVEAFVHLIAFVDIDRLRDGAFAPVAFTHLGLATVLYPASGLALVYLAWKLRPTWSLPQQTFAVAGMIGGIAHTISVPATLLLPDTETSGLFAVAGITMAIWAIAAGLVGVRATQPVQRAPEPMTAEPA